MFGCLLHGPSMINHGVVKRLSSPYRTLIGPVGITYADAGAGNGCRDTVQLLEWDTAIVVMVGCH